MGPGAGHQGLGRDTPDVDTGSADQLALHHCHLEALAIHPLGKGGAGLACADDDGIVRGRHGLPPDLLAGDPDSPPVESDLPPCVVALLMLVQEPMPSGGVAQNQVA